MRGFVFKFCVHICTTAPERAYASPAPGPKRPRSHAIATWRYSLGARGTGSCALAPLQLLPGSMSQLDPAPPPPLENPPPNPPDDPPLYPPDEYDPLDDDGGGRGGRFGSFGMISWRFW